MTPEKETIIPTKSQIADLASEILPKEVEVVEKVATHDSTTFRVTAGDTSYFVRTAGRKNKLRPRTPRNQTSKRKGRKSS